MWLNAWEIAVEEKWLALEFNLRFSDHHPEKRFNKAHFDLKMDHGVAPRCGIRLINRLLTPICIHLTDQSLWKKNGPRCRCLPDAPATILNFQDDHSESRLKTAIFGH